MMERKCNSSKTIYLKIQLVSLLKSINLFLASLSLVLLVGCHTMEKEELEPATKEYKIANSNPEVIRLLDENIYNKPDQRYGKVEFRQDSIIVLQNGESTTYSVPIETNEIGASDNLILEIQEGELIKAMVYSLRPDKKWFDENYRGEGTDLSTVEGDMIVTNLISGKETVFSNSSEESSSRKMTMPCPMTIVEAEGDDWYILKIWIDHDNCESGGGSSSSGGGSGDPYNGSPDANNPDPGSGSSDSGGGGTSPGSVPISGDEDSMNDVPCHIGFVRDSSGECVPDCPFGYKLNNEGDCIEDKPCWGDPFIDMEISDYNSGKNANRFGCVRKDPTKYCNSVKGDRLHAGIDLKAPIGTNIHSLVDGTVFAKGENNSTLGNYIIIKSEDLYYLFAHLHSKPSVSGNVSVGDIIGLSGESATVGEPHLHIEVRKQIGSESYNSMKKLNIENYLTTTFDNNGEATNHNGNCQ